MMDNGLPLPARHTKRYRSLELDAIYADEYLVIALDPSEQRARLQLWDEIRSDNSRNYILISNINRDSISLRINSGPEESIVLTDADALQNFFKNKNILLDVSGLPHHVWAPILRAIYLLRSNSRILYVEPESYSLHPNPSSSALFDLTKEFEGLSPLPGFAKLDGPDDENNCIFIALLGFEGNRPRSLLYELDPPPTVIPIVGVPGFQVEFPTYTITCNQEVLDEFNAHQNIRYCRASCPFELYATLKQIRRDYPDKYMYIAPVGTKPHGLGALLYGIINDRDTEILFDHPVRKTGRTKGVGIIHIYNLEDFYAA